MSAPLVHTNDSSFILLGLYTTFFFYHLVNRGVSYRGHHKALSWHILGGSMEIILYYGGFNCSLLSIAGTLMHSVTSLILVKNLPNGYPPHTRPAYQAGSLMRPVQIIRAYYTQSPVDYHDAIMPIHAFVYARAIIFILGTMGPSKSFLRNVNSRFVYTQAIFGGALIAIGHCSRPEAICVYVVIMHTLGKIGVWTSTKKQGLRIPILVHVLMLMGFSSQGESIMDYGKTDTDKVPEIGHLPVDLIGHHWARFN
ncbi:hypothetical protein P175DRAFT_0447294 [Aspergillus ochraceoroseus IBT 24754]|uniref:Uncharacterized protein n=1 Tax=Aspergillus ochraceoroseus IBT 24754 TaxID=1392256 RepID=A0A2T5LL29_9EURO|nr:uncharacterized protein P175DRAFT_0447294 [Aspergillus ochraceoroseus IBT 24754]PTU16983.1 hypothetical protein P175DRAFT_0447294 [Aspergillus ochraceoroseus IBT 24754]